MNTLRWAPILFVSAWLTAAAQTPSPTPQAESAAVAAKADEDSPRETWANCRVLAWVRAGGWVQIAQVMNSSGSALLDDACLNLSMGRVIPAKAGTAAEDRWAVMPIQWVAVGAFHKQPPGSAYAPVPAPSIARDYRLEVGSLPADLHVPHREAVCGLRVAVSAGGEAQRVKLTHSTDDAAVDDACAKAAMAAHYTPARRDDHDVAGVAILWIRCGLPD